MSDEMDQKARGMGWLPEEEFRGAKDKWVDAETYVKRGEDFVPFLRASNKKLEDKVTALTGELSSVKNVLTEARDAIEVMKEYNSLQTRKDTAASIKELTNEIKEARNENDIDKEEQLREQLAEAKEALKQATTERKPEAKPAVVPAPPEWNAWLESNAWWNDNAEMRAVAVAVAAEMAKSGELNSNTPMSERFEKVGAKVKKLYAVKEEAPSRTSKVEGSSGGRRTGGGKSFADLPAEAQEACDRFGKRVVGDHRAYKTLDDWRKKYVKEYEWS